MKEKIINFENNKNHYLVAGMTGSGKSVMLHQIIRELKDEKLILIDPKKVEFNEYRVNLDVYSENDEIIKVLEFVIKEMENRYKLMAHQGLKTWNQEKLVVIIDEFANLILSKDKAKIKALITRIAQEARAAEIHLIVATQRPSASLFPNDFKANFGGRISLQVADATQSRMIIGKNGAEKLQIGQYLTNYDDQIHTFSNEKPYIFTTNKKFVKFYCEKKVVVRPVLTWKNLTYYAKKGAVFTRPKNFLLPNPKPVYFKNVKKVPNYYNYYQIENNWVVKNGIIYINLTKGL